MSPRLVLIGMPGSGKSSVGAELAERLGTEFADSDDLIVEMTGRSIAEIFRHDGEPGFRAIEQAAVVDALEDFAGVLALGGGAVTSEGVREALRATGVPVVALHADLAELLRRVGGSHHRPLLAGDVEGRLQALEAERAELYRSVAGTEVSTTGRSVAEVVETVRAWFEQTTEQAGERT